VWVLFASGFVNILQKFCLSLNRGAFVDFLSPLQSLDSG
jgi:hypothetical protein